ncbi:MAG: MFS transporter [Asgard group archaeon]|nr:MFS transporter [Asgard group archaeon]
MSTLTVMVGTPISPTINTMAQHFNSIPNIEFLTKLSLTIPALSFAIVAFLAGLIIDRLGRKPVLISCLFLYILAGTAGFYVDSIYIILGSRVVLGIALAGVINSTSTLIADYYRGEKRNHMIGLQIAIGAFGGVIFILIGGALADIAWNFPFLVYFFPVLLVPASIFILHEPQKENNNIIPDLQEEKEERNHVTDELMKNNPLEIITSYVLIFIVMFVFYSEPTQLSFYIVIIDPEVTNFMIGLVMAIVNLVTGILSSLYKIIKKRLSIHVIFLLGFFFMGGGFLLLSYANSYWMLLLSTFVIGIGFGLNMPNLSLYVFNNTAPETRGRIFSGYNAMMLLGQFLSPLIFEPIIRATNFSFAFLIGGLIMFGFMVIPGILLGRKIRKKRQNIAKE